MPPRTALSTPLRAWKCPSCRSISQTSHRRALGPESPKYIPVPEPPQSSIPDRPWVKGVLPVPRELFSGLKGRRRGSEKYVDDTAPLPQSQRHAAPGSREEWKHKLADQRRQNLREGLSALKARKIKADTRLNTQRLERRREREALVAAPEREDERITAPSHGLDLEALLKKGGLPDPTREARLQAKRDAYAAHNQLKKDARMEQLHDLYTNARHFIVNNEQLERAVDEAFGSVEDPVTFGDSVKSGRAGHGTFADDNGLGTSKWVYGKPIRVQDMMNGAAGGKGDDNSRNSNSGFQGVNKERMRRIGEALTGGKMVDPDVQPDKPH